MSLIDKLLSFRKIDKVEDLAPEEQAQISNWKRVLNGETLTVDKIKEFCETQVKIIEDNFSKKASVYSEDVFQKACLHVYLNILKAIEAPEAERAALEQYLTSLITPNV